MCHLHVLRAGCADVIFIYLFSKMYVSQFYLYNLKIFIYPFLNVKFFNRIKQNISKNNYRSVGLEVSELEISCQDSCLEFLAFLTRAIWKVSSVYFRNLM
jgi:hypothetical protein